MFGPCRGSEWTLLILEAFKIFCEMFQNESFFLWNMPHQDGKGFPSLDLQQPLLLLMEELHHPDHPEKRHLLHVRELQ